MSTELVTPGQDFLIKQLDRSFGGRSVDLFKVDGNTGKVAVTTDMSINGRTFLNAPTVTSTTAGASNTATLQLKDGSGGNHAGIRKVYVWLSTTAGGVTPASTTGLTTTVSTGALINADVANLVFQTLTDATGKLVITVADAAGAETRFVNFELDGKVYSSAAIVSPA
jgi:hypothetical protein